MTEITRARASAMLFGGAALLSSSAALRAQAAAPLRVGTILVEAAAEIYFAQDAGFFAKAGLVADIQAFDTGPAIAAAVVANALDIGYITVDAAAAIHQKHVPLVLIAPSAEYLSPTTQGTSAFMVPANSTVRSGSDLNGKTIAVIALNGITHIAARAWIDQNGGDSTTAKFIEVPPPAMPAALAAARVDAAWVTEPFLAAAKKSARVLGYGFDVIGKRFLLNAWFTTQTWAREHPDLVLRFAQTMRETAAWANANHAASAPIVAKYTKIDPGIVANMTRSYYADQLTPALLQPLADISAKYNNFAPFPVAELIYTPVR
ncbi:MAG: ABC transporter substrate-binding protein [Candidatus Lustribacter sp.]|jgi:NitT/TauT family transport system substrate-binding protein